MNVITWLAFNDELQKIAAKEKTAVSSEWIYEKARSGGAAKPDKVPKFIERTQRKMVGSANKQGLLHPLDDFKKYFVHSKAIKNRAIAGAGAKDGKRFGKLPGAQSKSSKALPLALAGGSLAAGVALGKHLSKKKDGKEKRAQDHVDDAQEAADNKKEPKKLNQRDRYGRAGMLGGAYLGAKTGLKAAKHLGGDKVGLKGKALGTAAGMAYGTLKGSQTGRMAHRFIHGPGTEKNASVAQHALEVGGLGLLAAPTIQKMRGKTMSDRKSHAAELGGLGVLAAHPTYELGKTVAGKLKGVAKGVGKVVHASVEKKASSDLWDPASGKVISHEVGSRAANRGIATASSALKKPAFTMDHLKKGYEAIGKKAPLSVSSALGRVAKHASIEKEAKLPMGANAMMKMHGLAEASKAAVKPVAQAAEGFTKKLNPAGLAKFTATGGHKWNPAAQAARAISL